MKISLVSMVAALFFMSLRAWPSVSAVETTIDSDSRVWFNAFSFASLDAGQAQDGGARVGSYNYVSMNYSADYGTHWALRVPFRYDTAGFDDFNEREVQGQELNLWDVLVDYTVSSTLLPGDIEVFHRYRIELPTSEVSNDQRKIASLRFVAYASRYINKDLQLEYWPDFTWNIHTQTVYQNEFGTLSNTRQYELKQRLTLWYRANPRVSLGVYAGTQDDWYNKSESNNTTRLRYNRFAEHSLTVGPSLRFALNRNFTFLASVQNAVPLSGFSPERTGKVSDLGQFKPDQTQFLLLSFINF